MGILRAVGFFAVFYLFWSAAGALAEQQPLPPIVTCDQLQGERECLSSCDCDFSANSTDPGCFALPEGVVNGSSECKDTTKELEPAVIMLIFFGALACLYCLIVC